MPERFVVTREDGAYAVWDHETKFFATHAGPRCLRKREAEALAATLNDQEAIAMIPQTDDAKTVEAESIRDAAAMMSRTDQMREVLLSLGIDDDTLGDDDALIEALYDAEVESDGW